MTESKTPGQELFEKTLLEENRDLSHFPWNDLRFETREAWERKASPDIPQRATPASVSQIEAQSKQIAAEISEYKMIDGELPLCGCGSLARYYVQGNQSSGNKYFRCRSYDDLVAENERLRADLKSPNLKRLKELFKQLSDEDRLAWLNDNFPCCRDCGSLNTKCFCMMDE